MSERSSAAQWEHVANEVKIMADHEHKVGISPYPFGDERVPATHQHRLWMRTAQELRNKTLP
jgi:hypothetical protein